jgi:hypothetical protein
MNIQINIKDKQVGEPDENGYITTNVDVTFTFDEYSIDMNIPIFNLTSDEDIIISVNNMCITQLRVYQNSLI